jgi:hypothetical protein
MVRRILLSAAAGLFAIMLQSSVNANDPFAYSASPFGLGIYQPYGIRYSTSVRTPPYFAVNPPVYYGQRHYRPYGASPFASLPLVQAGTGYRTRGAGEFGSPTLSVPHPSAANVNPFCVDESATQRAPKLVRSETDDQPAAVVRHNPYVNTQVAMSDREASK